MPDQPTLVQSSRTGLAPLRLVLVVFLALLLISVASDWYAAQVALPRYCEQAELVLQRLAAVLTEDRPAGDGAHRDYIVAAKLQFLVPRDSDEALDAYLQRLRYRLEQQCP
jgi:hypothetical protein